MFASLSFSEAGRIPTWVKSIPLPPSRQIVGIVTGENKKQCYLRRIIFFRLVNVFPLTGFASRR